MPPRSAKDEEIAAVLVQLRTSHRQHAVERARAYRHLARWELNYYDHDVAGGHPPGLEILLDRVFMLIRSRSDLRPKTGDNSTHFETQTEYGFIVSNAQFIVSSKVMPLVARDSFTTVAFIPKARRTFPSRTAFILYKISEDFDTPWDFIGMGI